jgi:arginine decarboxylase-like protein
MTPEELEKRGKQFFDKLNPDDKAALKWFLTGQIQNILTNEHGIGGTKDVSVQVGRRVEQRVQALTNDDDFLRKLAESIVSNRRLSVDTIMTKAIEAQCRKLVDEKIKAAVDPIRINVSIAKEIPEGSPAGYAQF